MRHAGFLSAAAGVAAHACLAVAQAAALQISPVTIELASKENGAAMTLTNAGDAPVHGQLRVFEWDQQQGQDVLRPTQALAASPPLLRIGPHGEQLVRVVRTSRDEDGGRELSYRVLIDELPAGEAAAQSGVQIRMRYSVPVFVDNGLSARDRPELTWTLVPDGRQWRLRVDNAGAKRARINTVVLHDAAGRRHEVEAGLLGYALPGRYREWPLPFPAATKLGARPLIEAVVNAEPVRVHAEVRSGADGRPERGAR